MESYLLMEVKLLIFRIFADMFKKSVSSGMTNIVDLDQFAF